jgi:hypothetical protein
VRHSNPLERCRPNAHTRCARSQMRRDPRPEASAVMQHPPPARRPRRTVVSTDDPPYPALASRSGQAHRPVHPCTAAQDRARPATPSLSWISPAGSRVMPQPTSALARSTVDPVPLGSHPSATPTAHLRATCRRPIREPARHATHWRACSRAGMTPLVPSATTARTLRSPSITIVRTSSCVLKRRTRAVFHVKHSRPGAPSTPIPDPTESNRAALGCAARPASRHPSNSPPPRRQPNFQPHTCGLQRRVGHCALRGRLGTCDSGYATRLAVRPPSDP